MSQMDDELQLITAANPLLVCVVAMKEDGELDVFIDGVMPDFLRPGALRAIALDLEAEQREDRFAKAEQN